MKLSTLILVAALAGAPLAHAQAPDAGGGPPAAGAGGFGGGQPPSPEQRAARQAARQAMIQACQVDMQTLCAGQTGGGRMMMCIRQNRDKVSQGCKDAMAKIRGGRRRRPGGFGAPPAPATPG